MTGLIWTIQLVHYPTFDHVADDNFANFAKFHASRISLIVLPAMIVELFTAFMMLKLYSWSQLNIISILIIWASTFFLSVPCHSKLQQSKDKQQISRLVLTNWPRTILWSARSLFFIWFLLKR